MASVQKINLMDSVALTDSADGDSKSMDNHYSEPVAVIKATAVHAATTVDAEIQHSNNKTDWFQLKEFTNIVGAAGKEALSITDHVLPYVRASVALSGATKEATVSVDLYINNRK
jgi:hypothetical protein